MGSALENITVLEFASYVSGPYAGMMLGDLGAEIIKVEDNKSGDPFRGWGAADYSATFGSVNRNKKSVILDLKTEEGVSTALALAKSSDILIENFRPGTMDRLGLGYKTLSKLNPRLIYCSVTGFGGTGPYVERPGYDTVGQAMGGLLSVLTDLETPKGVGISLSDHLTGMMAAYGCLAALIARDRTGVGQRVEAQPPSAAANDDAGAVRAMHEDNVAATRRGDAVGACVASPGGAGAGAAAGNSSEPGSSHHSGASPVPTPANRDTSGYDSAQQSPSGDVDMENVRSDEQAAALAQ